MTIIQAKGSPKRPAPSADRPVSKRTTFKQLKLKRSLASGDAVYSAPFTKAMNNPNWRQKRASQDERKPSAHGSVLDATDCENTRHSEDSTEIEFQTAANGYKKYRASLEAFKPFKSQQSPPLLSSTKAYKSPLQPSPKSVCQLLKDVEIPFESSFGGHLHLLQVNFDKPRSPNDRYNIHPNTVGIMHAIRAASSLNRPLPEACAGVEDIQNQLDAMDANTHAAYRQSTHRAKDGDNINEARTNPFHDQSYESILAGESLLRSSSKDNSIETPRITGRVTRLSSRQSRDAAFKKMLQKLHSSTNSHYTHHVRRENAINESTSPKDMVRPKEERKFEVRKPISGSGRRCATLSDNVVDYGLGNAQSAKDPATTLDVRVDTPITMGSLNPRAREFLSFNARQSPVKWSSLTKPPDHSYTNGSSSSSLAADELRLSENYYEDLSESSRASKGPYIDLKPQVYHGAGPIPTHFSSARQTVQDTETLKRPQLTHAFLPTIGGIHIVPAMYLPPYKHSLNSMQAAFPPSSAFQFAQPVTAASLRPCPVPKPKIPSASSQQAYEAWIEWRKANEPGYAMECKQRQQRRSQRIKTAGAQPDSLVSTAA